jgi:hypothetical protein
MYTPLEKYLLSVPIPSLNLPALIVPTEFELFERELTLCWEHERGVNEPIALLRILGVVFLPMPHFDELNK